MQIIPAIDLINGSCVRLQQGDYAQQTTYNNNPVEVALEFEQAGLEYLHLVDLDGARLRSPQNLDVLKSIATQTRLNIDFSGGLKTKKDIENALAYGAQRVTIGTIAAKQPELFSTWIEKYGASRIILGADTREGMITSSGWTETSTTQILDYLDYYCQKGIEYVMCTEVSRDGLLAGPALNLYTQIRTKFPQLKLIASGGVSSIEDLQKLEEIGCWGAIVGKAIYEKRIELSQLTTVTGQQF